MNIENTLRIIISRLFSYLLLVTISLLSSCGYDDGIYPEIEYVDIGHYEISDSILNVPAYKLDTTIRFKHSSNTIVEYNIKLKSSASQTGYIEDSSYTYDHIVYDISSLDFAPPLRLALKAMPNNNVQVDISAGTLRNIFTLSDSFSSGFTSRNVSYHDTLTIRGNLFEEVYHITADVRFSPSERVSAMVYSLKDGLVGFYIDRNTDIWVRVP